MRLHPICLILLACGTAPAAAQTAIPRLQDATVVAKGSTISILRLPISTAAGTIYRDVTIELHVTPDGRVTLVTDRAGRTVAAPRPAPPGAPGLIVGPPVVALRAVPSGQASEPDSIDLPQRASPPVVFQHFTAGTYTSADGSLVQLSDRGRDLIHGVPAWSISGDGVLSSVIFYSGPPRLNPKSSRLRRAGITGEDYAYGASDAGTSDVFGSGALIGVKQAGRNLTVVSFHHGCCTDEPEPTSSVTYTLIGH